MSPSASDIMVERYDVQDVERYKDDHGYAVAGAMYSGAALVGFAAATANVLFSNPENVILALLCAGVVFLGLSAVCLYRLKRGASA